MVADSKIPPAGEVEKVTARLRSTACILEDNSFDAAADDMREAASLLTTYAEDNERLRGENEKLDRAVAQQIQRGNDWRETANEISRQLKAKMDTLTTAQAEIERLRAESDLLRAETDAKTQTISAMQDRVDWAYKQKEAAEAGHRMQTKATLAFREDWLASQAQAEEMLELLKRLDNSLESLGREFRLQIRALISKAEGRTND